MKFQNAKPATSDGIAIHSAIGSRTNMDHLFRRNHQPILGPLCALIATFLLSGCLSNRIPDKLMIRTDFPGGSAAVQEIDHTNKTIRLEPAHHPGRGWDAWWYFRLDGVQPGETVTLDVGKGIWATPDRAMFSLDNNTWQHTALGTRVKDRIVFKHVAETPSIWFAWGPPFRMEEAEKVIRAATRKSRYAKAFTLTRSAEGRSVPALRISEPGASDTDRLGIWIQARQHAWESGSSWVAAGMIDWLVSDDPRAIELRQKSLITIVPIMDLDNVERGAGGKNQMPQDHNRDWSDAPHWPEVRAAIKEIKAMSAAKRFDLFLDLHNPGPKAAEPFFFVVPDSLMTPPSAKLHKEFQEAVKIEMTGPLPFTGKTEESGPAYDPNWQRISSSWVRSNTTENVVAMTLETPWNKPECTIEGYKQVGRELGLAIERYFKK